MRLFSLAVLLLPIFALVGCASSPAGHSGCGCSMKKKVASATSGSGKATTTTTKRVRTTAYTAHEAGGARAACGSRLKAGAVTSAAADWSRYPVGTKFRIKQTGQLFEVDDYGSALVGKDTIDLFKTSGSAMRNWGVRNVEIEVLEWGSPERSLDLLKARMRNAHVREMVLNLRDQVDRGDELASE